MATFNQQLGIAFGTQTTEGTADSTIAALNGSLTLANGIILGDPESGVIQSGITHGYSRRMRERPPVSGSFTQQSSNFLEEEITSFEFVFPMSGPRTTTGGTPADGEFEQEEGISALLAACGLTGAVSGSSPTVGFEYKPADVSIATARIFDSGRAWVIRDIRGSWSLSQTPGEVGIMSCSLSGVVDSFAELTFPTFDYEEQATIDAPNVASVSPSWGNTSLGWTDLTIACENNIESIADSASSTGSGFEQTGRTITVDMVLRDDSSDIDQTRAELIRTTAPTNDLFYTVGTAATGSDAAVAYQVECNNLEVRSYTPDVAGKKSSSNMSAVCTSTTDGTEFSLVFL